MARTIKQFRYCGSNNDNNSPASSIEGYKTGSIFDQHRVYPILQLGIQGLPGTKFYLNGSIYPIYIGDSGIYDLEVKNGVRINHLRFDETSLRRYTNTSTSKPILIVDVIYEKKEA